MMVSRCGQTRAHRSSANSAASLRDGDVHEGQYLLFVAANSPLLTALQEVAKVG